jgi:hypothetical protein
MLAFATQRAKIALQLPDADLRLERQRFHRLTTATPVAALMVGTATSLAALSRGSGSALSDVWLGDPGSMFVFIVGMVGALSIAPALIIGMRRSATLFGKENNDIHVAMSPEERKLTNHASAARALPHLLVGFLAVFGSILMHNQVGRSLHTFAPLLTMVAGLAFGSLYTRRIKALTIVNADDSLTWQAQQLSRYFGRRIDVVRVDSSGRGKTRSFCTMTKSEIVISEQLLKTFTPAELEFTIANRIATPPQGISPTYFLMLLPVFAIFGIMPMLFTKTLMLSASISVYLMVTFGFITAVTCFMVLVAGRLRKSVTAEMADRTAADDVATIDVTKDYSAATSALTKLAESNVADTAITTEKERQALKARWQTRIDDIARREGAGVGV